MRRAACALLAVSLVFAFGCSKSKKMKATSPDGSKVKLEIPGWYNDPPEKDDFFIAVATATSKDLQTSIDKAKQDARAELARMYTLKMEGLTKRFVEETGLGQDSELLDQFTQVTRSIVSDELYFSSLKKQELQTEAGVFRAYVMMEMPIGEANSRLMAKMKAQENLYTRFRATEAYEELDEEIRRYEEWKQQQMGVQP
jgi:hypothetical protein